MGSRVGPDQALGELRHLLFGGETRRLDEIESELRRLATAKLDRAELLAATADVIAGALRRAEVARHRELAEALAPVVVGAIRAEIHNSRDSMVEALYPLMGRLVSAAVAAAIRNLADDLARRIDALVSARAWRWRMKSWATGRPIGEIALAESQRARIARVFCLERGSGQLLAVWPDAEADGRSDLVSGMIAAISEFAATTFAREGGELRALDLGSQHVLLRSSATLIVAAECEGVLDAADEARIDSTFLALIALHERAGRVEPGDLAAMAAALKRAEAVREPGRAGVWAVRAAMAAALVALLRFAGGAFMNWRREVAVETALAQARAAEPEAAAYPLSVSVDHRRRRVTLAGLLPDAALAGRIAPAVGRAAEPYSVETRLDVVASAAVADARAAELAARLADSEAARGRDAADADRKLAALSAELAEARRSASAGLDAARREIAAAAAAATARSAAADQRAGALETAIETARRETAAALEAARRWTADAAAVAAKGLETERSRADQLGAKLATLATAGEKAQEQRAALAAAGQKAEAESAAARDQIAELRRRSEEQMRDLAALRATGDAPLERLKAAVATSAIFFSRDAELADSTTAAATVRRLAALIVETGVGIRVVGHTDETGSTSANQRLSRERADAVVRLLTEAGVPAQSIRVASRRASFPISDVASANSSPNRRVTFELLLDKEPVP